MNLGSLLLLMEKKATGFEKNLRGLVRSTIAIGTNRSNYFANDIENKKLSSFDESFLRGLVRIRTGVDGFADRCLTARPRDRNVEAKIVIFYLTSSKTTKFLPQ